MSKSKIIPFPDVTLSAKEYENDRVAIFEVVVRPEITEVIQEAKLNPMKFIVDEESLHDFLTKPILYREIDGAFGNIFYDCWTEGTLYRVECKIYWDEESVNSETDLYKLDKYYSGNREWLHFYADEWERGPGEMFYDAKKILRSHRWG